MTKSLFGYNTKETDELVNTLQNRIDVLVSKIAKMTMQLTQAENAADASKIVEPLNEKIVEMEKEISAMRNREEMLQSALNEANTNYSTLKLENENLSKEIHEHQKSNVNKEASVRIGDIFGKAYADAESLQLAVAEEMNQRVDAYAQIIAEYNTKMNEAVSAARLTYNDMMEGLAWQLDTIFSGLSTIESGSQEIEKALVSPQTISSELKKKIEESTNQSIRALTAITSAREETPADLQPIVKEEIKEVEPETSPVQELMNKYFKNAYDRQIISVYTNVSKDGIFYGKNKEAL